MSTPAFYDAAVASKTFAERLRKALHDGKLSIAGAADIMQVTEQQMRRYLDGTTPDPKLFGSLRLCARLGLDPFFLAFGSMRPATSFAEESPPQDERLGRIEGDLREMRRIVDRLEAEFPAAGGAQGGRRKRRRSA